MVHLISHMEVEEKDEEAFLEGWKRMTDWLRGRNGFRAVRLHRSASPAARFRFVGMSIWDDQSAIAGAMGDPAFLEISESIPTAIAPSVYEVIEEVTAAS